MITETQKNELQKVLKSTWQIEVLNLLKKRRVKNRLNKNYSKSMLRQVLYGKTENEKIEKAILDVFEVTKLEIEAIEERKEKLLSA